MFFFECYGYHRDLHVLTHAFPTRRSSDRWILFRPLLLALLAKGYQLVGAKAPAFDEPLLPMPLPGLVAPVPGAGGIAGAFALRFDLPDADHERPGRLEVFSKCIGGDEAATLVVSQIDAVLWGDLAVRTVKCHVAYPTRPAILFVDLGTPRLRAPPFLLTVGEHLPDRFGRSGDVAGDGKFLGRIGHNSSSGRHGAASWFGVQAEAPLRAASILAMSIFCIPIMASNARWVAAGSGSE